MQADLSRLSIVQVSRPVGDIWQLDTDQVLRRVEPVDLVKDHAAVVVEGAVLDCVGKDYVSPERCPLVAEGVYKHRTGCSAPIGVSGIHEIRGNGCL